jgi:glyoxylase-like metal-dependent hydrolase (beta-lactamase superfamily II)
VACSIFQTEVGLLSNLNELIACNDTGNCAVIDPAFEVDRLLREAAERGWKIAAVLVTHTHHDHVDGVEAMVQATGAKVYVGAGEVGALKRAAPSAQIVGLSGGETITIGTLPIAALPTPGHTVAGTSYLVDGNVCTGDTLFVGGCGRTDFPGGDAPTLWRRPRLRSDTNVDDRLGAHHQSVPVVQERGGVRGAAHRQESAAAAAAREMMRLHN